MSKLERNEKMSGTGNIAEIKAETVKQGLQ